MKKEYLLLIIWGLLFLSNTVWGQCEISHIEKKNALSMNGDLFMGQSFTADCDGYLESITLFCKDSSIQIADTLNIYIGLPEYGPPTIRIPFKEFEILPLSNVIFNIYDTLAMVKDDEYSFDFRLSFQFYLTSLFDYPGGTLLQDKLIAGDFDMSFSIKISDTPPVRGCKMQCVTDQERPHDVGADYYTVVGNEFDPTVVCYGTQPLSLTNDFNNDTTLANAQIPDKTNITWTLTDTYSNVSECSFTFNFTNDIDAESQETTFAFPVPATDFIIIPFKDFIPADEMDFRIFNIIGRQEIVSLETLGTNEVKLDISHLSPGIYFIQLSNYNSKFFRFIKK